MNRKSLWNGVWFATILATASVGWVLAENRADKPKRTESDPSAEQDLVSLEEVERGDVQKYFREQMDAMRRENAELKRKLKEREKSQGASPGGGPADMRPEDVTEDQMVNSIFNRWFNDDFFRMRQDPFADMQRLRQKLQKPFDSWYGKKFGGNVTEIKRREDDAAVYYEIGGKDTPPKNLDVKVERGLVTVTGRQEQKSQGQHIQTFFSSTFTRSIPVPEGVDENKVTMKEENGKIVLRFPKTKA